jgi:hypothetical protein
MADETYTLEDAESDIGTLRGQVDKLTEILTMNDSTQAPNVPSMGFSMFSLAGVPEFCSSGDGNNYGPGPATVRTTVTTPINSTTQAVIPGLTLPVAAGQSYIFESFVCYIADSSGGFAYITMGGTCTTANFKSFIVHSADAGIRQQTVLGGNGGMQQATALASTGVYCAILHGHITVTLAGTLTVNAASSGAFSPDAFTVQTGSDLRLWFDT